MRKDVAVMAFSKIKSLLFATSILTVISMNSKSSIAISFEKNQNIHYSDETDVFVEDIARTVDNTDLECKESVKYLSEKIKDASTEYIRLTGQGAFCKATIVRATEENTYIVEITNDSVDTKTYCLDGGLEEKQSAVRYFTNFDYSVLAKDISDDAYERALKFVWLESPTRDFDLGEIATAMLNDVLISEGYSEVALYYPEKEKALEFVIESEEDPEYC